MTSKLKAFVENLTEFQMHQTLGVGEADKKLMNHINHNAPYEFEIQDSNKEVIGMAQEQAEDSLAPFWLKNAYLKGHRAMTFKISDESFDPILYLKKDNNFFSTSYLLYNENKEPLGSIKKRFQLFITKFDFYWGKLRKRPMAFIHAPITKPWTYPIYNPRKREIGKIKRLNPSVGQALTYRATFKLQCEKMSVEEKIMALSASIALAVGYY